MIILPFNIFLLPKTWIIHLLLPSLIIDLRVDATDAIHFQRFGIIAPIAAI
jgi:hypothetical protein